MKSFTHYLIRYITGKMLSVAKQTFLTVTLFLVSGLFYQLYAQTVVSGVVYDQKKITIPGVTVIAGNPPKPLASTNGRGEFRISVPNGSTLVFKFMGYIEKRVTLKPGQTTVSVVMEEDQSALEEVVVRGFVSRSKQLSTGSSVTISGDEVKDVPVANVEQLLQGKVPGLNIQVNTGAPGFRGSTQIRGLSTLTVSGSGNESFLQPTSPLYVIDGVPLDADGASEFGFQQQGPGVSPLSMIPQEDIASIEILKDAQATSLYGSMAAYGVIIITTKRGNSEIPRVRYTNNTFMKAPPALRATLGGNLERQLKIQQILANARGEINLDDLIKTPFLSDSLNAYYNNSTDWQSLYYRTTYNQSHNIAIDGGNPTFNYKANLGYFTEKGVIRNTGFDRYSANLRMEYAPNEKFKFTGQINAQIGKQNKGDGAGLLQTGVADGGATSTLMPGPSFYQANADYVGSLRTKNNNDVRVIRPVAEVSYSIFPGFRATTFFSYEFKSSNEDTFTPAAANNQFAKVYAFNGRESNLYSRTNLTYAKTFGDNHNIFINAFNEIRKGDRQNSITQQERTPNDQFQGPLGFDGYYSRGGGILTNFLDERAVSFALATSYDYQKKYVVDLSYRLDGSSGNGFDNLYSRNPAIGLRWNFDKEEFLDNWDWLNMGALRLSWGINVIPNGTLERIYGKYDITGNYNGQQGIGLNFDQIPNPNLKPTTTTQYNAGLDFSLFNNKVDVIYDTYYKKVDNLLFEENLSNTVAFGKLISNDAGIVNYGHELSFTIRPLSPSSPFNLMVTVNGAYNRDVLLKLPAHYGGQFIRFETNSGNRETYLQHNVFRVGTPSLSNYLLINEGVYATDDDVPINPATGLRYSVNGQPFRAGDPIIKDLNGDYVLDANDYARTGNASPLFTGGLATNITYKGFGLNINASFTAKRTILNNALADRFNLMKNPFGLKAVIPLDEFDMWRQPGDIAKYPYAYDYSRIEIVNPYRYDQTLWAEDGSYLKINNVVLSYMFDKKLVRSWGINNLRVYVSMDNVYTFSGYSGPNPENVTTMGRDISEGYPVPRTYNIGCNLEF
ncbi:MULTISPECIES: SusC/RagA family TonB-linked outer membrane protein [Olivibacter]|uniref:SusC/RagA family TonB-linked outer membrane protein n=1 Tax=Olivibacter jilunii TaxID=985016 RepID=A0ABW6AWG7_9SPHI|nr:SusC/RagA family TonB-linked outer membrane protein [Olivibacter sp. UJ_SKK_5.1]MDX3913702.1 SusC/RagA family TonB-linked outer membrane protein [Pseudosphingobacterium sp.]